MNILYFDTGVDVSHDHCRGSWGSTAGCAFEGCACQAYELVKLSPQLMK
jgi:hypothetical protein